MLPFSNEASSIYVDNDLKMANLKDKNLKRTDHLGHRKVAV